MEKSKKEAIVESQVLSPLTEIEQMIVQMIELD